MKRALYLLIVTLLLLGSSCKPTERNYRTAYDAALSKREKERTDPDMELMLGGHVLDTSENGSAVSAGEGGKLPRKAVELKFDKPFGETGNLYLAIAKYSMPTNARAQVRDMNSRGDSVEAARDAESNWYVIAARCETDSAVAKEAAGFIKKHSGFNYIGLGEVPLVIVSSTQ